MRGFTVAFAKAGTENESVIFISLAAPRPVSYSHLLNVLAEKTGKAFVDTFLNEYGYLLDYVDGNMMDWSVRPNMRSEEHTSELQSQR